MSYLVETNVISEFRKGKRADASVKAWFAAVDDEEIYLSVLTIGEFRQDVERIRRRNPVAATLLAATAKSAGLTLVTRNASDIERTGVDFLDPFVG